MKIQNVVVWGLGPHARKNILPAIRATPGLALFGVCTRDSEVRAEAEKTWSCRGWSDATSMLASPEVDVVFLATPIGLHASHGDQILNAGKHFWCEKPLTTSSADTEKLVKKSREKGLTLNEGFMYLYHGQLSAVRAQLASKALGEVHTITSRFGIPALERPGFRSQAELGGGAFWDVGCYPVSLVLSLIAEMPEVEFAETNFREGESVDASGRTVLRFGRGSGAVLEWATGVAYRNELDIWGTEGTLSTRLIFSKSADYVSEIKICDQKGRERLESVPAENHFVTMFSHFYEKMFNSVDAENERIMITRRSHLMDNIFSAARRAAIRSV